MENETIQVQETKLNIGDVFVTSWGYDQTNYDYIIVTDISPSGKTCLCQLAEFETVENTQQANIQKPEKKGFGFKFRMRVELSEDKIWLRGSYPYCAGQVSRGYSKEEVGFRLDSFSKINEGDVFYETDSQFGH